MATEALVTEVKRIVALAKAGNADDAYKGYATLFRSAQFKTYPLEEQRQALKLVANIKVVPSRATPAQLDAFKAAVEPLTEILGALGTAEDFQWLGICCLVGGDEKRAGELFRTGLKLERERNPQSDLCGSLMKWVAAV
ncbi:MAG TPA: hypothetical protein VH142_18855 [Polyangiaceae bacterium]|jgi:hypothetical protein|nr:hypothetical protein [Polyangiaceae bacterium]